MGMNSRTELTDEQWEILYQLLLLQGRVYVGNIERCRRFLNAVPWILRGGAQWRLLPQSLGKWNSVFKRFSRWCKHEVWKFLHAGCTQYADMQQILIDSTITLAHACAAGAAGSSAKAEALGRSKGGFTTKIHAITDALGNPLDFILTGGQASDIGQAENLLALTPDGAAALVADKGYDSDAFIQTLTEKAIEPVIPSRSNRINPRDCDWSAYKERHLIECFFNKIKHYRRISSRYEKLARNHMGFIRFASALIWLR